MSELASAIEGDASTDPAPMTPTSHSTSQRMTANIEHWKRQLLDLTKRNRALNFRPTKVSTITVIGEQPAEIFRHLFIRERTMKFKAAAEGTETESEQEASETVWGDEDHSTLPSDNASSNHVTSVEAPSEKSASTESGSTGSSSPENSSAENVSTDRNPAGNVTTNFVSSLEITDATINTRGAHAFVPYDRDTLNEKQTDEWLQTTAVAELLDRSLRRIDEQTRLSLEEQGVNTLFLALGMVHYTESATRDQTFRAPLVFLPVTLTRKSARSGYTLSASDDDPLVNPALTEYLRREHGITLPEIPDAGSIDDDYDLQTFFVAAVNAIKDKQGWRVSGDVYLSLFSFQKFVMYKDLEAKTDALHDHRLITQLITRRGDVNTPITGLPDAIRQMSLDQAYPPEQTYQVVDADSSQLRAIAAVANDYDLVIEGPPGTGKSQTITNLIAQSLSVGKSVLFVAEKMAALSVVYDRLVRTNLGEFCLELHSTKANKRSVMKELATTLDASLQSVAAPTISTQRIPQVRDTLAAYVSAVHNPFGALGRSPYDIYGELGRVIQAPRVEYTGDVETVTGEQLDETLRLLRDLAVAAGEVGVPDAHPWRDTGRTFYTENDLEEVRKAADVLVHQLRDLGTQSDIVREHLNAPPVVTLHDIDTLIGIAAVLARSPGAPLDVLQSDAWNQPPTDATTLITRGREIERIEAETLRRFHPDILAHDHESDIAYIERKSEGLLSFFAFLDGRYRSIKNRWQKYRLPGYTASMLDQAHAMKEIVRFQQEKSALRDADTRGRALFGALWMGEQSDWAALENYVRWVVEYRTLCVTHGLGARNAELVSHANPDISQATRLEQMAAETRRQFDQLRSLVVWPAEYFAQYPIADIIVRLETLMEQLHLGPRWAAFESARKPAVSSIAGTLLPFANKGELSFSDLIPAFLRAFYFKWLSVVVQSRNALEKFHTLTHEERIREFRELDERVLEENRARLVGELRDRVQERLRLPEAVVQMPYLRREMTRQRGLNSIRRTMQQAGTAIRAIKPCFMMSPLTVAQLLEGQVSAFDVIIFDEASQLSAEDAVGAIVRGKQLVVVGDPKQLPPTNFFSISSGTENAQPGDDGLPLVEDSESILEEFMGAGMPMSRLKWHYRSAHESLINFSNIEFYDAELLTFPSVETSTSVYGLQFEYLPNGVYEGKGLNPLEASRVADEVVSFAQEQLERQARGDNVQTLGVGTFNLRQQIAILDELERRRRDDPSIESFFDRTVPEAFFVKNLENIQGDERDVIFISVTYAKGADGKVRYHFGPLNGENGWRRLNVLTTRARQRMKVFSSMRGDEIDTATTTSRGANLLRDFLVFAERGTLEGSAAKQRAPVISAFEQDLTAELESRGVKVVPKVGVAGYRIDLAVVDETVPGRFLCGIECDGPTYQSSETARDRDRTRYQVLKARGWNMYRVWSTDWFKDRNGQIERLLQLIAAAKTQATPSPFLKSSQNNKPIPNNTLSGDYIRPLADPYSMAPGAGKYTSNILEVAEGQIVRAIVAIVDRESPIHAEDLRTRVAALWSARMGSRVEQRIRNACVSAEYSGVVARRGEFYWDLDGSCPLRSREGTRIPPERIAPEEYERAVMAVLKTGHGFSRPQLTIEARAVLGFGRTTATLDAAVQGAVDRLLARGIVGEGSVGIRLRA